jgi:hypothetical protein
VEAVSEARGLSPSRREGGAKPRVGLAPIPKARKVGRPEPAEEEFDPAWSTTYGAARGGGAGAAEDLHRSIEYHHSQPGTREVSRCSPGGRADTGIGGYLGELRASRRDALARWRS